MEHPEEVNVGKLILQSLLPQHQINDIQRFKNSEILKAEQKVKVQNENAGKRKVTNSLQKKQKDQENHRQFYNSIIARYLMKDKLMQIKSQNSRPFLVNSSARFRYHYNLHAKDDTMSFQSKFDRLHDPRPHPNLFIKLIHYLSIKPFKSRRTPIKSFQVRKATLKWSNSDSKLSKQISRDSSVSPSDSPLKTHYLEKERNNYPKSILKNKTSEHSNLKKINSTTTDVFPSSNYLPKK